tara:strand:+ start:10091 stop:11290 length:1200 start_codon:yes stop_codon:yes gene_type:complete
MAVVVNEDAPWWPLAHAAVREGVNLQPQQGLIIRAPIEAHQMVRSVAQVAYGLGSGPVHCIYEDPELLRIAVASMEPEPSVYSAFPVATKIPVATNMPEAAQVYIVGPRPRLLQGITTERLLRFHKLFEEPDDSAWAGLARCTVPYATQDWASWIRPKLEGGAAQAALWDDILKLCCLNTDLPAQTGLGTQYNRIQDVADELNRLALVSLQLRDQETDLTVDLLGQASWCGGGKQTAAGAFFKPTLPLTPVQCLLQGSGTHGTLSVGQAITIGASSVCDLKLEFRRGRVAHLSASQGADLMERLMQVDDNAARLGQVGLTEAIQGVTSPQGGFLAPIMDKACRMHVTLGCPPQNQNHPGANHSDIGIDLMFGDSTMEIDGVDANGATVALFRNGKFRRS